MKIVVNFLLLLLSPICFGQAKYGPWDGRSFGIVLSDPQTKNVKVTPNVVYMGDEKRKLSIDVYTPPGMKAGEKLPAVIFLDGVGTSTAEQSAKNWEIYKTWPQLVAANGFVGINMETDNSQAQKCFENLFKFLDEKGKDYGIDASRLGIYAASANTGPAGAYLMKPGAYPGIKAAALYYGSTPTPPFRKDLPVLFVVSEMDVRRNGYTNLWTDVLQNNAPWTIKMGTGMPHGFDGSSDTDESRRIIKETISFWKNELEPMPTPPWTHSGQRDILASMQEPTKAAALLISWLEKNPNDKDAIRYYASTLKNLNDYPKALETFQRLLKITPDDMNVVTEIASLDYVLGKSDEAEKIIADAEKTGKFPPFSYTILGSSLLYNKLYSASAKYYEKSLAIQPNATNYYNLACAYSLNNEKDKAFANLFKAIDAGYDSKAAYLNDPDLASLKTDKRFDEVVSRLR